jgi:hypothetical protein
VMAKCDKRAARVIPTKGQFSCIFRLDSKLSIWSDIPNLAGQNINSFFQLECGNFVMMSTKRRFYIGEVLDIYKQVVAMGLSTMPPQPRAYLILFSESTCCLLLQVQSVRLIRFCLVVISDPFTGP